MFYIVKMIDKIINGHLDIVSCKLTNAVETLLKWGVSIGIEQVSF